jgi:hypothetical protein
MLEPMDPRRALTRDGAAAGPATLPADRRRSRRRAATLAVSTLLVSAYLIPGQARYATSSTLPIIVAQAQSNGVRMTPVLRDAFNRAAIVYDSRTDLQETFGRGDALDARRLLEWGLARPDASAAGLARFASQYRTAITEWDSAGPDTVGRPASGAPGLPAAAP